MKIDSEENKFLAQWDYYEVARFVPSLNRVIRDKKDGKPFMLHSQHVGLYADHYNNTGIYTSVYAYNKEDIDSATRLGPLYFDIDSSDMELAYKDCEKVFSYLCNFVPEGAILIYFTGKKGFHIECEPVALGISPSNELPKMFRFIANDIKQKTDITTLDFSVYDPRRMWRYPGSKHQSTGLYKTLINQSKSNNIFDLGIKEIIDYCSTPQSNVVLEQKFDYKANEWYREYTYRIEEEEKRKDDPLEYFNKYGSKAFKDVKESEKVFDKNNLLRNCTAVNRLYEQAKSEKFLEHEARLFLCSILTYTEDSIRFLHEILSNCSDYNFQKSSAHINDWIRRRKMGVGGRPYTCERANSVGVGCGECALEKKNKWVQVGGRFIETQEKSSPSPIRHAYKSLRKEEKNAKQ